MNSQKFKEIFNNALDIPPDQRTEFLAEECAGDDALFQKIQSLLNADSEAENKSFLKRPAFAIDAENLFVNYAEDSRIDQIVGGYKIVKKIGEGGMGAVYLATRADGQFERSVAVKLVKRGMDTEAILRRFRRERQILAGLEHPYIARLLDAGMTADDLPFFIMELVEGTPIDEYCRENALPLNETLKLFRKVCQTIAYAHQNLIVHRDLKPSNILVTKTGEPKLLDFGIAKLTTQDASENPETVAELQALTPEYASPEQIRGEKLTTATDVYSLGVILYELLTENRPYKFRTRRADEIARVICEQTPMKPSNVILNRSPDTDSKFKITNPKALRGDLDNIVLKSLQKDASRRYKSVEQFGEDIYKHLENLPVVARRDTFKYRATKFFERNKIGVSVVVFVFLLLVGGIFAVWRQARIAETERARAERRAENLRKLSGSFAVELHDAILNLPGSLPARHLLLTRAVEQLDALAADSDGNVDLQYELAAAYYNLGELPAISLSNAERNYRKALSFYENLAAAESANPHYRIQVAKVYGRIANVQKMRGDLSGAVSYNTQRIKILSSIAGYDSSIEILENLSDAYYELALNIYFLGKAQESLENIHASLKIGGKLIELEPDNEEYKHQQFVKNSLIAANLEYLGNYREAIEALRESINESAQLIKSNPNDVRYNYELWTYHRRLGVILEQNGENQAAADVLRYALELIESLLEKSPDDTGYQRNAAFSNVTLGRFLIRRREFEKAIPYLRRARDLSEKLISADSERGESFRDLAAAFQGLGNASLAFEKHAEAANSFRQAQSIYKKIIERNAQDVLLKRDYAEFLAEYGDFLINDAPERGSSGEGRTLKEQSLKIRLDLKNSGSLSYADAKQTEPTSQK